MYDIRVGFRTVVDSGTNHGAPFHLATTHASFAKAMNAKEGAPLTLKEVNSQTLESTYGATSEVVNQIDSGKIRIFEVKGNFHMPGCFEDAVRDAHEVLSFGVLQKYASASTTESSSPWTFSLAQNSSGQVAVALGLSFDRPKLEKISKPTLEVWRSNSDTLTLWWTGAAGKLDYSPTVNGIDASSNLKTWTYSGPIAPFQAKNKNLDEGAKFFRATYPYEIITGSSQSEPIGWNGSEAFPYQSRWSPKGVASSRTFELVAFRPNLDGTTSESPVTTVTGAGNDPYLPASAAPFIRAVITEAGNVVWQKGFSEGTSGTLSSIEVAIPVQFDSSNYILSVQYRPDASSDVNAASSWLPGCATYYGGGNSGYGDATPFAIPPNSRTLGASQ